ncbi:MAG: M23 family metallopeptidase [Candidatus Woykebacteria bacterium]
MPYSRFGEKVYIGGQWESKKKYNSLSNVFPKIFTAFGLAVLLGFFVSLGVFFSAFSSWFGENPKSSKQTSASLLRFNDEVQASQASGEEIAFSRSSVDPSALRVNRKIQWPIKGYVTGGFNSYHQGIDIGALYNTPIYPFMEGKVLKVVYNGANLGRYVEIQHEGSLKSLYAHMNFIAVEKGQKVTLRTKIGSVGLTGYTTGPHLHFGLFDHTRAVNPLLFLR